MGGEPESDAAGNLTETVAHEAVKEAVLGDSGHGTALVNDEGGGTPTRSAGAGGPTRSRGRRRRKGSGHRGEARTPTSPSSSQCWSPNVAAPEFVPGSAELNFGDSPDLGSASWHGESPEWNSEAALDVSGFCDMWGAYGGPLAESPRAQAEQLLTMVGAWGALATRRPLEKGTLLRFQCISPQDVDPPEELKALKCVLPTVVDADPLE